MTAPEALKIVLLALFLLLGLARGDDSLGKMGEFPVLDVLKCYNENEESLQQKINVSNLLYLTYHEGSLYFFFKEFFIKQEVPELWQRTGEDGNQDSYTLFRGHPKAARYKGSPPDQPFEAGSFR